MLTSEDVFLGYCQVAPASQLSRLVLILLIFLDKTNELAFLPQMILAVDYSQSSTGNMKNDVRAAHHV